MTGASRADWIAGESSRLGRYQLIRRLATGGMAEIYLARAAAIEGFEKFVVLKRILPQHSDNDNFIRMFLAEARLAATLHHPNIVQVYDIGEDEGTYFFTMEYVQGIDLRQLYNAVRRADRQLPLQHILHIITGVCAGLHYAHDKKDPGGTPLGIVHRDVSPSNVLVTFDGGVKVVDFGIAKAANVSTTAGTLKGKIPYMSPEQCRSQQLDRRSDVFSIGTLLWELTVGRRLFQADNELALLGVVAKGEITRPTELVPEYPPGLESILMKALAVDLEHRYETAQQLQLALEDYAHEARLPLSAARLQPLLQEVCAERIAKLDAMLAAHHEGADHHDAELVDPADDVDAPEDETAIFGSAGLPSGTPGPSSSTPEATEPGPYAAAPATSAPVTSVAHAPMLSEPAPTSHVRAGAVLGIVAGLGLVAGGWALMSEDPGSTSPAAPTPSSATITPDAPDHEPSRSKPTPKAEDGDPLPPPADPEAKAAEDGTLQEPVEAASDPPQDAHAQDTPTPRPRTKGKPTGSKRSTSRPSSGKSNESSTANKGSKPKWDPKAAPPPGL